ncbi:MAG TPA: hypothetical protein VMD75_14470 [Candidatus Binataceae bacterium]|nr:hypothetical protein [Candidatus Binataceae bacterium]
MRPSFTIALLITLAALPTIARAQVGRRNFIEPLIVEDADPSNELDLIPGWVKLSHGTLASVNATLEKQLSQDFSIQLGDGWNDPACLPGHDCSLATFTRAGRHRQRRVSSQLLSGFEDFEILTKYAFVASARHEFRLAIGTDLFLTIDNPTAGGTTHTYVGPIVMFSKGMGDIPDWQAIRYLRPFALQADLEDLVKTGGTEANAVNADWVVSYQFSYLMDYVRDFGWPAPLRDLNPFGEFTYGQYVKGGSGATQPDLRALPGIAYVNGPYQVSLATEFSLNRVETQATHAAVVAMLSLTLDQIMPEFGWTPM